MGLNDCNLIASEKGGECMDAKTKAVINDAVQRLALALKPGHWQALVAVMGIKYPYTFGDKLRVIKGLILAERSEQYANQHFLHSKVL